MSAWVEYILRRHGDDPTNPKCLLLAPTGVASSLIGKFKFQHLHNNINVQILLLFLGGTTLQTGLGLTNKGNYHILTPEKLDMFRRAFKDLQVIIIDEVSMCGADKLYDIHKRICEIIISEELFGNIAILFVGDLMQVRTISFSIKW